MILKLQTEQIQFLQECFDNIMRIQNTFIIDENAKNSEEMKGKLLYEARGNLAENSDLPERFVPLFFEVDLSDAKRCKLFLLKIMYNKAADCFKKQIGIDLNILFARTKEFVNKWIDVDGNDTHAADQLMKSQRSQLMDKIDKFTLDIFPQTLRKIFIPKSVSFLEKYGFFEVAPSEEEATLPLDKSKLSI